MTYEEARWWINDSLHSLELGDEFYIDRDMLEVCLKALEKQIPQKPDRSKRFGFCRCPNGHNIPKVCENGQMRYCPFCSQALDWSEE